MPQNSTLDNQKGCISMRGARTHNLKNINVDIPYHQLIAITGLSGAGKASLGMHTLLAEGCRRYIASFNAHTRQFLEKIKQPPVDNIQGVLPSIGLGRKEKTSNPRTRVGITTDIYPFLKILYARLGTTYSPISNQIVKQNTIQDVVEHVQQSASIGDKLIILISLKAHPKRTLREALQIELGKGFARLMYQDEIILIEDFLQKDIPDPLDHIYIVIDRLKLHNFDNTLNSRIADSAKTAFFEGQGTCIVEIIGKSKKTFSDQLEADGITFHPPTLDLFDFNSPHGSCRKCSGEGKCFDIDPDKVIPDQNLSIKEGAILPWQNAAFHQWQDTFIQKSYHLNLPVNRPYKYLTPNQKELLWKGKPQCKGILQFFDWVQSQTDKIQFRIFYTRYQGKITCEECKGTGLRKEVAYVKVGGKNIIEILSMSIDNLYDFFMQLTIPSHQAKAGKILLKEIQNRLYYLKQVDLGYLSLDRMSSTLSGGEYQRARLAKMIGSPLIDNLYVLDKPMAGLHPKNIQQVVEVLVALKNTGNTIVVLTHEELVIRASSNIIDIGPKAGTQGGHVVFQGTWKGLMKAKNSYTADYLSRKRTIPIPPQRKKWQQVILLKGVNRNNLKDIDVSFPLGVFTAVTGVSGSGKSTLVDEVLYHALCNHFGINLSEKGQAANLSGDLDALQTVVYMGQDALSKSARSNLVTYLGVYEHIRKIFAKQPLSLERKYPKNYFSFNIPGGRCEECAGDGNVKVNMQFKEDILEVRFLGKNIIEVLNMTVRESIVFFKDHPDITNKLHPLIQLGLDFLRLGQPSTTFSSGEAQRVKLASYLNPEIIQPSTFFIFDEPSVSLHIHNIYDITNIFRKLVNEGHTVIAIEHNTEVIKTADWIIDLGPEGGAKGGRLTFCGTPEQMIQLQKNHTAHYLRQKMTTTHPRT